MFRSVALRVVVGLLTVAVALARSGVVAKFRSLLPIMNKVAGVLFVVAGFYVAYYGWYEVRLFNGSESGEDPVVDTAVRIQTWLVNRVPDTAATPWFAAAGVVVLAATGWISHKRYKRGETSRSVVS